MPVCMLTRSLSVLLCNENRRLLGTSDSPSSVSVHNSTLQNMVPKHERQAGVPGAQARPRSIDEPAGSRAVCSVHLVSSHLLFVTHG